MTVDNSQITFRGDASIGGEGVGHVSSINGGVLNFGGNVTVNHLGSTLSLDCASQINMTGSARTLDLVAGTFGYDFANTPAKSLADE